jgi:hypothetical protein
MDDAPADVFKKTENIRLALYVFVRCFKKGESKEKKNPACDIRNLAGVDLVLPPLPAERYPFGDKQELLRLEREYITPTPPTPEQSPARPR